MRFSDGMWLLRPGVTADYPVDVESAEVVDDALVVWATTTHVTGRGDTVNRPLLKLTFRAPAEGVIKVCAEHFTGAANPGPVFDITAGGYTPEIVIEPSQACLISGRLAVRVAMGGDWGVRFYDGDKLLTESLGHSLAHLTVEPGTVDSGRLLVNGQTDSGPFMRERLALAVGERVYGLGERFGPFVKNGQSIDTWNQDGGTSSEQAYKNVPFYMTSAGYGVFVNHLEDVSFEVGSEAVEAVQFSVAGQRLEYCVFAGPTPKDVLRRYTGMTGRPPLVPAWSYGLWLSTSFTTEYDEATVIDAIDGMAARDIPLSVFHLDSFWMPAYRWCDFGWDKQAFPDPAGMLRRLHERGLKVCAWMNPYVGQRSPLFGYAADHGYLLRRKNGEPFQWDLWQAGMGVVDLTNPDARDWWVGLLSEVIDTGVDCFKTDFGERIPVDDVVWFDGSDPHKMHNYYSLLYTRTVYELLVQRRGVAEAVIFARSATAGGQRWPVHWGGDSWSTYASMGETLRGGLSLAMSGFAYWSHDIGGFEGKPPDDVFTRWVPFGLLSSHSRLHGSESMRLPWLFGDPAVEATRRFTKLKMTMMPYLGGLARQATQEGWPLMRPMVLEFPDDPGARDVDTQFMLGDRLLVAPVFRADGEVDVYLPGGGSWVSLLDDETMAPGWAHRAYDLTSLPLLQRPDTVLPVGARDDRPDYDWADGVTLRLHELADGHDEVVVVPASDAGVGVSDAWFHVRREGSVVTVETDSDRVWAVQMDGRVVKCAAGTYSVSL